MESGRSRRVHGGEDSGRERHAELESRYPGMSEFLGNYGFFILIALLMVVCHFGHGGGHGGHGERKEGESDDDKPSGRGHQH